MPFDFLILSMEYLKIYDKVLLLIKHLIGVLKNAPVILKIAGLDSKTAGLILKQNGRNDLRIRAISGRNMNQAPILFKKAA
ncbi:MAG: hypothetical protein IPJ32_13675 [Sphingobacteriaceae bacterium]|nr:hypothetical protein [Sphingobacteriaceae bacterium]